MRSGYISPFQADTIFGHLCWAVAHNDGEEAIVEFLTAFKGGNPPFVLSDGFPGDFLPKPLSAEFNILDPDKRKEVRKINLVTLDEFERIRRGDDIEISTDKGEKVSEIFESAISIHNTINRVTHTVLSEGGLYSFREFITPIISIYAKVVSKEWKGRLERLFNFFSKSGYGRRKSTGEGQFSIEEISDFPFGEVDGANGFVTLSSFCPRRDDPSKGLYETFVKYGKLGEEFTFCGNPFKRPLLMVKTGSVFKTPGPPAEYYGRMVEEIAPAKESEVVQYAYAFAVPIMYPER